ncbi:MAG: response regulator [Bacteroidota bacterium]
MKKILLIEDNDDIRDSITEILMLANYKVLVAKNGKEGIEAAQQEIPDLIICDIMMPVLDGYGVLHLLSKNDATSSIPFIFLSAKAERSDVRKGMDLGADDYLTKPFASAELLSALESRLKRSDNVKKEFSKNIDGLNDFLTSVKSFEDLKKLSLENKARTYKKKERVYSEEDYPKGIFFLNKGKIKTHRSNDQGKELITGLYKEGDFFGYLALLNEETHSDSATALEDAEIYMIHKDDFYSLIYKNAEVSRKFIKMISDNLREKEEQLVRLAYSSVRKLVAEAIITLYNRYKKESDTTFSMKILRDDLANLAGTATETTIRILCDLRDEGLVDMKGSTITVLDYDKLQHLKY